MGVVIDMRCIDADALFRAMEETGWYNNADRDEIAEELVLKAPTIEPKKGKWIDKSNGIEGAWNYCSVCGEQAIDLYDFCPNCGARMTEEDV